MNMDPIADMIIRIKNAGMAGKPTALVPYSELNFRIAEILAREGYIQSVARRGKKMKRSLEIELAYEAFGAAARDRRHKITNVRRVSHVSHRMYRGYSALKHVRQGSGISIVSTPKGLLTDTEARKAKVGGEVLIEVW
ncbi:MAG: 30S ribosomal protein S8 [Candidatus Vogelbacteria bacterium]|nr:30S ribosomal protein S8 [Candidatus Vogelbacteria bacterium]